MSEANSQGPARRKLTGYIWCGGRPLTQEHLLPQWTKRIVLLEDNSRTETVWDEDFRRRSSQKVKQGTPFTKRPKVACRECNHGWMSALEQAVKPILKPMILGQRTSLSVQDAQILAAWVMKTAYVSQGIGEWFATDEEMRRFAQDPYRPPKNLRAWIGAWRGGQGSDVWTYAWEWAEDHSARAFLLNSHLTAFAIGHVAVVAARSPDPHLMTYGPPGYWGLYLRRLWPISQAVNWPPTLNMILDRFLKLRRRYVDGLNAR